MTEFGDERLPRRFWDKVRVNEETGCWEWTGYSSGKGYGRARFFGSKMLVHRAAYLYLVGEVPYGLVLDHLCRVRHCVNPDHLEPVTPRENTLRGETIAAEHAAKERCPHGHEYSYNGRQRVCRQCRTNARRLRVARGICRDCPEAARPGRVLCPKCAGQGSPRPHTQTERHSQ